MKTAHLADLATAATAALALAAAMLSPARAAEPALATLTAQAAADRATTSFDGVVEALRQTVIAAQVAGAVVQLDVKAGDRVRAGQVLLRIDARGAEQNAAAGEAQVRAARAAHEVATRDFERQQLLFDQHYISRAALDRSAAEFKAAQAQVAAQLAQAGAARTQSGLHVVRAPYAGVVAEVPVALGDMALPGRPLLTLYDPSALRVTVAVPQTVSTQIAAGPLPRVELPGLPAARQWLQPVRVQVLPTVDAATHTVQVRADLAAGTEGVAPGAFARLWLPVAGRSEAGLWIAAQAVVRRAEVTALYVLDGQGRPLLRQVRLGRSAGTQVEVLAGLAPGERVVADAQAAARTSRPAP